MPDDGLLPVPLSGAPAEQALARHDRPELIAFVTDAHSEEAVRTGLADAVNEAIDLRRGGVRAAITTMQKAVTPRLLLIDVSGEEQPLTRARRPVECGRAGCARAGDRRDATTSTSTARSPAASAPPNTCPSR